jgi:thiamine transport system substrate-binding protein
MRVSLTPLRAGLLALSLSVSGALAQPVVTKAGDPLAGEKPKLTVMTYSSFAGKYGPGPKLKAGFEAICGCELVWQAVDDSGAMVARLKLEGAATTADVVVGVDMYLTPEAAATGLFAPHGLDNAAFALPIVWKDATFAPVDYGWFSFVYDSTKMTNPPQSLAEMAAASDKAFKIVIQDPRSSSVGLGGLLWMRAAFGDQADDMWAKLRPKVLTVTKSWSEAYGLFLKGEADMALSYSTSPAYHMIAEKKDQYKAVMLREGNFLQVETAGLIAASKQPDLAKRFLSYLTGAEGQKVIPTAQWMYPVHPAAQLPPEFGKLALPGKSLTLDPALVTQKRREWIDSWLGAMAK